MEKNCVSLDTAKKLKAAGFPQKSVHSWLKFDRPTPMLVTDGVLQHVMATGSKFDKFAAPTAQEIANELPDCEVRKYPDRCTAWRRNDKGIVPQDGPTMAEALAALWLKLKDSIAKYGKDQSK